MTGRREHDDRAGTNEVRRDAEGGRWVLEEREVTFRWTRYSPLSYEGAGPFRTLPLALRFLRLAADIEHERMAAALDVEVGTVEGIERGNVIPQTSDVDAWVECCGGNMAALREAIRAADMIWPPESVVLELPQLYGSDAPSVEGFKTAERLIRRLRGWEGVEAPPGIETLPETMRWLRKFFEVAEPVLVARFGSIEPARLLAVEQGRESLEAAARSWWGDIFEMWFNVFLACQAPAGCRFFPTESGSS